MPDLTGLWSVDGIDLWTGFRCGISSGTADFLKLEPAKPPVTYDWQGANGVEVDLTAPKYAGKDISLSCFIACDTNAEVLENRDALFQQLMRPGLHMFRIGTHGWDRVYACEYKKMDAISGVMPMPANDTIPGTRVYKFTLSLFEPVPNSSLVTSRIITESGLYLVT